MAFFKKRGGNRGGRGGGSNNFNSRNPNKVFRRNPNHPGGIRKNSGGQDNSQKPFRSNRPLNKRNFRGRRRNEGTNDTGRVPKGKNGGKFKTDNLDRDLDKYWGKDHKDHQETRAKILNDDLDSYWQNKPSKTEKTENEQAHAENNAQPQEVHRPAEHVENVAQVSKKKPDVPL